MMSRQAMHPQSAAVVQPTATATVTTGHMAMPVHRHPQHHVAAAAAQQQHAVAQQHAQQQMLRHMQHMTRPMMMHPHPHMHNQVQATAGFSVRSLGVDEDAFSRNTSDLSARKRRRSLKWFNSPEGKNLRAAVLVNGTPHKQTLNPAASTSESSNSKYSGPRFVSKWCALCSGHQQKKGRKVRYGRRSSASCNLCQVALCTRPNRHGVVCFELWHRIVGGGPLDLSPQMPEMTQPVTGHNGLTLGNTAMASAGGPGMMRSMAGAMVPGQGNPISHQAMNLLEKFKRARECRQRRLGIKWFNTADGIAFRGALVIDGMTHVQEPNSPDPATVARNQKLMQKQMEANNGMAVVPAERPRLSQHRASRWCALCSGHINVAGKPKRIGRRSSFKCSLCKVPLCTRPNKLGVVCFSLWHELGEDGRARLLSTAMAHGGSLPGNNPGPHTTITARAAGQGAAVAAAAAASAPMLPMKAAITRAAVKPHESMPVMATVGVQRPVAATANPHANRAHAVAAAAAAAAAPQSKLTYSIPMPENGAASNEDAAALEMFHREAHHRAQQAAEGEPKKRAREEGEGEAEWNKRQRTE